MTIWRQRPINDFAALLLHIRESNEQIATHNYRLTKLEKSREQKKSDTGDLDKRKFLPVVIADRFSLADLRLLVHGLDGDYENLEGETKEDKALSLVLWMQRNGRFAELIDTLWIVRPREDWDRFR